MENAKFGKADLGRQNMVQYDRLIAYDPRSYGNFAGIGSMGINKFTRMDNSLKYASPTFAGFSFGAGISTANSSESAMAGSTKELALDYANGGFKATAGWSGAQVLCNGANTSAAANTVSAYGTGYCNSFGSSSATTLAASGNPGLAQTLIAASYDAAAFTLKAGFLSARNAAAITTATTVSNGTQANTMYFGGVAYKINPANTVTAAYYTATTNASTTNALIAPQSNMIALDYQHAMSKRTTLYAIAGFMANNATGKASIADNGKVSANYANQGLMPPTGGNQNGATIGVKHVF
jgi:predicted porin